MVWCPLQRDGDSAPMARRAGGGDLLYQLAQGPARGLLRSLGLPTPVALTRGAGVFDKKKPLTGQTVLLLSPSSGGATRLTPLLEQQLGATVVTTSSSTSGKGAPLRLLVDCTSIKTPSDVSSLMMGTLQPALSKVPPNSRIVLLSSGGGSTPISPTPIVAAALTAGLYSFARSLAKELGASGTTVNVVRLPACSFKGGDGDCDDLLRHAAWPLAFFLLPDSAFVSGQELCVTSPVWKRPVVEEGDGEKRVALVTGASKGIGAAIATRLTAEGLRVIGVDVPESRDQLTQLMDGLKGEAVCMDITSQDAPKRLHDLASSATPSGGLDVLVHNAGVTRDKTFRRMQPQQFEQVMRVNLEAIMAINEAMDLGITDSSSTTAVTPPPPLSQAPEVERGDGVGGGMLGMRKGGRVILLSSINGIAGAVGQTNYSFTKGALIGYARELASTRQAMRRGITINCIAPGFIETDMVRKMPAMLQFMGRRSNALSQGGVPEDVAAAAAFFADRNTGGVSGQVLRVCGLNAVGR